MNPSRMAIPPAFHRASSRFRDSLSDEEKNTFSHLTSEKEVWNLVEELQKEQGSRTALRNMTRIEPFINGMAQYASVIEVFVQVKPEIMALVWGPLKLLLQLACRFVESFDRILDAVERIGENLPRFRRFGAIFSYSDQIQHVISLIYEDILDFYRRALKFFRRRAWKIVFSLTWDSFENRFGLILNNLQRHQSLVDNEARAEDIEQAHNARQEALKQFEAFQERDRNDRMMTMFNWLNPANIEADKDKVASKKISGTGNWLFETKDMKEWIQGKGKFIWLTGNPGSGKTVLSFSILEHLEMRKKSTNSSQPILYFFCSYSQAHRNTSLAILRTFIYQIVNQDNDLLPYVYREWLNDRHSHSSVSKLKNLLYNLLEASVTTSENAYIIVDGLDELPDTERQDFLPVLKTLRSKAPYNSITKVFVASRNLSDIRTRLSTPKATEVSIEGNNTDDIHEYIDCESQRVGERLGLEAAMREIIADSLRTRAGGMFLWVHLIIESLLMQTTIKGIRETLGNLPKGLDQAYERILLRIKSLPPHAQEQANKILEWLTCGYRILKIGELEDAFAINSGDSTVDGENRPFRDSFKSLCGPIIELTDQDTIVFVHFSAKEYLLSRYSGPFIHRQAAHLEISLVCITYQCFRCFGPALSNDMAAESVLNGDLRLFAYVQSSWLEHIREFCRLCPDQSQLERLSVALRDLFGKRNSQLRPNFLSPQANRPNFHQTFSSENLARIHDFNCLESDLKTELMKILEYGEALKRKQMILGTRDELTNWCDENNPLTVDRSGRALQQVLEDLLHGTSAKPLVPSNVEKLRKLYGMNLYKCRYQSCWMSPGEGFTTLAQRKSHEEKHVRAYRCQEQGCIYGNLGFTSKNYLRKHMKDYHTVSAISNRAIEDLRQPLTDDIEENENQSIFALISPKNISIGSGPVPNSGNSIIEDLSLESFELTNQLSEKTEFLDQVLASRAPPLSSDPSKSASLVMGEIQATIDSCVDRFLDPGVVTNLKDAEVSQIEITLRQLSGQLKSWKKLVQSFHIASQSSRATEQLVFNILHCREQYLDNFETPKGRYTTTLSVLEKTRDRLVQCYFYIQNAVQGEDKQTSFLDDISNQRVRVSQKAQQEIPQQPQLVPESPQTPPTPRTPRTLHLLDQLLDQLRNISESHMKRILEGASGDDATLTTLLTILKKERSNSIVNLFKNQSDMNPAVKHNVRKMFTMCFLLRVNDKPLREYIEEKSQHQETKEPFTVLDREKLINTIINKIMEVVSSRDERRAQEIWLHAEQFSNKWEEREELTKEEEVAIAEQLFMLDNPAQCRGWQVKLKFTDRIRIILQIAFNIRLDQPSLSQGSAIQIAACFERATYEKSLDEREYRTTCAAKILELQEATKRKAASEDLGTQNSQPGISQQTGIGHPQAVGQNQDISVSLDKKTSRALRFLIVNGIDPTLLTPQHFAAFQDYNPATQTKALQDYHLKFSGIATKTILEQLREAKINPSLLTPSELLIFQPKGQLGKIDELHARQMDGLHTRQLLLASGFDPNRWSPQVLEVFQGLSPVYKIKNIRLHLGYMEAYSSMFAAAIPTVQTEKGISPDQLAPQQSAALPSQDPWSIPKLWTSTPQSPEPPTRSIRHYTNSRDLDPPHDEAYRSYLEYRIRNPRLSGDPWQPLTNPKSNFAPDSFPEKYIYTPRDDPEYTEGGQNWGVQHHDPGAQPYSDSPDPSPRDRSGTLVQNQKYHGEAREQSEKLPPLHHHATHPIPPTSQRFSESMMEVDGPEDDPFYGLEDELFGPRN